MSSRRSFVTGAAGFVGAVLVRRLLADGHEVHVLVRPETNSWRLSSVQPDLRIHRTPLTDESALATLMQTIRPEVVFHLAAHGAYPTQTDADRIIDTNILGTWNLLKASASIDYEVFVNTGSSSEYGFKDYAMRETDLLEPNSYYSVAKSAQTLLCQQFARSARKPVTTLRLFSVYGPFEEPSRLVPTLVERCLRGDDLELVDPNTARDFVFVDDVVEAYLRLDHMSKLSGEIVNIGTGVQSTIRQVVDCILRHTGARVECRWGSMPARVWDQRTWVADASKSHRLLGWQARTTLSDGLEKTVSWHRSRAPQ